MATQGTLAPRKAQVLRAVVRDYIRTGEPVGSGALTKRYRLGVSAATIRNEMAALEELGYLAQPHTSAGRVPTDLGYRFFVDTLPQLPELSEPQQQAISSSIDEHLSDLEDLMRRTAQVLSRLTPYAAVALSPSLGHERLVRAELVPVGGAALLLAVTDSGHVDKRTVELPEDATPVVVQRASAAIERALGGLSYAEALPEVARLAKEAADPQERAILRAAAEAFVALDREPSGEHAFVGGVGNIAGEEAFERRETVRQLFEALDEEATLLRVLHGLSEATDTVAVGIGQENPHPAMQEASIVIARYRVGDRTEGAIALIGPTRMEYPSAMSTVGAVARRLSDVIEALS